MANVKNYHEQGGEKWVVSGELELVEEGRLLFNGQEVKPAKGLTDSEADSIPLLKGDFNNLLEKLYLAGLMVADKSDLENAILAAMVILEDAEVGDWDGAYLQEDLDTYSAAIAAAQAVADDGKASQTEVNAAKTTLEEAVTTFQDAAIVVDKTELEAAITAAQTLLSGAIVGTGQGKYPQEAFDIFSAAITEAQTVANDDKATQVEVDEAKTTLGEALTAFEATVIE